MTTHPDFDPRHFPSPTLELMNTVARDYQAIAAAARAISTSDEAMAMTQAVIDTAARQAVSRMLGIAQDCNLFPADWDAIWNLDAVEHEIRHYGEQAPWQVIQTAIGIMQDDETRLDANERAYVALRGIVDSVLI